MTKIDELILEPEVLARETLEIHVKKVQAEEPNIFSALLEAILKKEK